MNTRMFAPVSASFSFHSVNLSGLLFLTTFRMTLHNLFTNVLFFDLNAGWVFPFIYVICFFRVSCISFFIFNTSWARFNAEYLFSVIWLDKMPSDDEYMADKSRNEYNFNTILWHLLWYLCFLYRFNCKQETKQKYGYYNWNKKLMNAVYSHTI